MTNRDETGRFIGRNHRYRLNYTDSPPEYVTAASPSAAVAARTTPGDRPHTMTDLTQLAAWQAGLADREGIHTMPLLDRMRAATRTDWNEHDHWDDER